MEKIATLLNSKDFIKLHCLASNIIDKFEILRLSFKNKTDYELVIMEISKVFPLLKFTFGNNRTKIYNSTPLPVLSTISPSISSSTTSTKILDFHSGKFSEDFLLRSCVYLSGPDVPKETLFFKENELFKLSDILQINDYIEKFQKKFVDTLNVINTSYNSRYVFSFKFVKIFVRNEITKFDFNIDQNGLLTYIVSNKSTDSASESNIINTSSNKKRRIYNDSEYMSSDEE